MATWSYIDSDSPATGQILFELIKAEQLPMTRAIAENLFVAISTDTGSFQYPNTTARTFEIAAELVRSGVDVGRVKPADYTKVIRDAGSSYCARSSATMRFDGGGKIASFRLSLKMAAELGVKPEDNEGLIDHLRAIQGVIVAVFFRGTGRRQSACEHAFEERSGRCVRDLPEIWRRRTQTRGRGARARFARGSARASAEGNLQCH